MIKYTFVRYTEGRRVAGIVSGDCAPITITSEVLPRIGETMSNDGLDFQITSIIYRTGVTKVNRRASPYTAKNNIEEIVVRGKLI